MTGIAGRCRRARRKTVFRHLRPHFVASAAIGQHVVRSPKYSPAPIACPPRLRATVLTVESHRSWWHIGRRGRLIFCPSLRQHCPRRVNSVVAMIHGFSMAWHSQVSSGSARAPDPSSGSGVIDFRSDASELPAIARRLHLLLKGSNNHIYHSRELFRSR